MHGAGGEGAAGINPAWPPYTDPVAMKLLADVDPTQATPALAGYGMYAPPQSTSMAGYGGSAGYLGVPAAIPAIIKAAPMVSQAAQSVAKLFGGGGTYDPMKAKVWGAPDVKRDGAVLDAINVRLDGEKWIDLNDNHWVKQDEGDKRVSALAASLIDAYTDNRNWWFDNGDQHHLTSQEAYDRWVQWYGQGATLGGVLRNGGQVTAAASNGYATNSSPVSQTMRPTTAQTVPSSQGQTVPPLQRQSAPITRASMIDLGMLSNPLVLGAVGLLAVLMLSPRRRG